MVAMAAQPRTDAMPQNAGRSRPHSYLIKAVLAFVGIALFIGFLSLGTWQVQRRAWKLALIERVEQRVHAAPVALPAQAEWPQVSVDRHEYLPVQVQGLLRTDRTLLAQAATELGAGFWVMTPLQLQDGAYVWVNRGFIAAAARKDWAQPVAVDAAPVTVIGLLRLPEPKGGFLRQNDAQAQRWYSRDVLAMSAAQGLAPTAPFFIDAGLPHQQAPLPAGEAQARAEDGPRPGMTVVRFANSHAVYALTWYGLALMVVGAAWLVVRADRKRRA